MHCSDILQYFWKYNSENNLYSPEEEVAEMSNMMKIAEMTRKPPTPVNESQAPSQPAASDDTLQDPFSLDALTRVSHVGVIRSNQSN